MRTVLKWVISILILLLWAPALIYAAPRASEGFIDLADWTLPADGIVTLDGEWEFYPDLFVHPKSFSTGSHPPPNGLIAIPGSWNSYPDSTGTPMGSDGFATYRLRVQLPSDLKELALYI